MYSLSYVIVLFVSVLLDCMFMLYGVTPSFHDADAQYFYEGARFIINNSYDINTVYKSLLAYTWEHKYYGFIVFDALSILGTGGAQVWDSISIKLCLFSIYSIFLVFVSSKKLVDNKFIMLFLVPCFLFLQTMNYRDGVIGIVLFFLFLNIINNRWVYFSACLLILQLFRDEFVLVILASVVIAWTLMRINSVRAGLCYIAAILIGAPFIIEHEQMNASNLNKIPLSFFGETFFQLLSEFIVGVGYYDNFVLTFAYLLLLSIVMIMFNGMIIDFFVNSMKGLVKRELFAGWMVVVFYFTSICIYTYINNGFQMRVRLAYLPVFCLMFTLAKIRFERRTITIMCICLMLSLLISIRNVRWVL